MIPSALTALFAASLSFMPSPMSNTKQASVSTDLWSTWQEHRVLRVAPPCLRHEDVQGAIDELGSRFGDALKVREVGTSFEGRPIRLMELGDGQRKILLWSQMHGDEPSATPALLDLVNYLLSSEDGTAQSVLGEFTLLVLPMLNPDGTERATRRSAQGIDMNRDALQLATPEARLLKSLRAEYEPFLGFNLHDQDRRKLVGETRILATQSVLAVAGDEQQTLTEGRQRAMRVCSILIDALEPFIPGGIGRFNEDWSPRAFGDNLTAWGTPIVLLESGGLPEGKSFSYLSGLTFVGLVRSLYELARNDAADFSIQVYDELPRNRSDELVDVILSNAGVVVSDGKHLRRSLADVAFDVNYDERDLACNSKDEAISLAVLKQSGVGHRGSALVELGDASFLDAKGGEDLQGHILLPLVELGVEGLSAQDWLDGKVLERWTRLGVGEVTWRVAGSGMDRAQEFAAGLGGVDRVRVRVIASGELPRLLVSSGPKALEGLPSLRSHLDAITGRKLDPSEIKEILLQGMDLRRFGQASFMVLKEVGDRERATTGELISVEQLLAGRVTAVWYRGRVVSGESALQGVGKSREATLKKNTE